MPGDSVSERAGQEVRWGTGGDVLTNCLVLPAQVTGGRAARLLRLGGWASSARVS
jgi:hypothetical protein